MSKNLSLKLDRLMPGLANLDHDLRLKVGVLEGATNVENRELVAEYAAKNEFGTSEIPSRPAMRTTLMLHEKDYAEALAWLLSTSSEPETALRQLGEVIRGNMVESIKEWKDPPNSSETIKHKLEKTNGRVGNAPLYETGAYVGSISYEVVKE